MSTPIVEKIPHRKVGETKDHKKIELSWQQLTPADAQPEDFQVLTPEQGMTAEVPGHGQYGRSLEEMEANLLKAAQDHGKSAFRGKRGKR